jgi:hypothetical protein
MSGQSYGSPIVDQDCELCSRFDIVWPESLNPSTDDYSGVDALSYGLSTLVMGCKSERCQVSRMGHLL